MEDTYVYHFAQKLSQFYCKNRKYGGIPTTAACGSLGPKYATRGADALHEALLGKYVKTGLIFQEFILRHLKFINVLHI
jgi:hypothetical protein